MDHGSNLSISGLPGVDGPPCRPRASAESGGMPVYRSLWSASYTRLPRQAVRADSVLFRQNSAPAGSGHRGGGERPPRQTHRDLLLGLLHRPQESRRDLPIGVHQGDGTGLPADTGPARWAREVHRGPVQRLGLSVRVLRDLHRFSQVRRLRARHLSTWSKPQNILSPQ